MRNDILQFRKSKQAREPLRTINEMAAEFGVTRQELVALIRYHNGPSAELRSGNTLSARNVWYVPSAMREWWRGVPR